MKRRPTSNVYYLDQKRRNVKKSNKTTNKQFNNNVIELTTCCEVCGCKTTKKNFINGMYMCEDCIALSPSEIYNKVADDIEDYFKQEIQEYINWDNEDLDYLYYTVWCDDNNKPTNDTKG